MIFSFTHELVRDVDVFDVEVTYDGRFYKGRYGEDNEVDIDVMEITLDGEDFDATPAEYDRIVKACVERIQDDFEDHADDEADYRYSLMQEFDDD